MVDSLTHIDWVNVLTAFLSRLFAHWKKVSKREKFGRADKSVASLAATSSAST